MAQESGFEPLALVNVVARLGWTPKTDDILTMEELVDEVRVEAGRVSFVPLA